MFPESSYPKGHLKPKEKNLFHFYWTKDEKKTNLTLPVFINILIFNCFCQIGQSSLGIILNKTSDLDLNPFSHPEKENMVFRVSLQDTRARFLFQSLLNC